MHSLINWAKVELYSFWFLGCPKSRSIATSCCPVTQSGLWRRYLKHRCVILSSVRFLLLAFLAFVVPHVAQQHTRTCHNWFHIGSIGPVVVVPLGLMVSLQLKFVLLIISQAMHLKFGLSIHLVHSIIQVLH